jgi:hypothetical protein
MGRCTRVRPRCLRLQQRYLNCAVRRDYSSPGRAGSTSTLLCAATTRHPTARTLPQPCRAPRLLIVRLHRLYCAYGVHPDAPSRCSISLRSVALALVVHPFTPSRGSTSPPLNLLFGRTGSTLATSCAATTHLPVASAIHHLRRAPRLLVTRSHGLYINIAVRREYLSPGRSGSTSTTSRVWVPEDHVWFEDRWMVASLCDE